MRSYEELTYLGRSRRLRELARIALTAYGYPDADFDLVLHAGNSVYRVYGCEEDIEKVDQDLFVPGQFLLRVHQPGYQTAEGIELELEWLQAMSREARLPVPEPRAANDGRLLLNIATPGIPEGRNVSLLRWVRGRSVKNRSTLEMLVKQGRLMAQLHNFSQGWQHPPCPTKRRYDWQGFFVNEVGSGMPNGEAWALLPEEWRHAFQDVATRVATVMEERGEDKDVWGLIHADLGLDANLYFWKGEPRPIDFDESGFGYWDYDLAIALEHLWGEDRYEEGRDALLEGYAMLRQVPAGIHDSLELFLAAYEVYWNLWATGGTHLYPDLRPEYEARLQRSARLVLEYVGE